MQRWQPLAAAFALAGLAACSAPVTKTAAPAGPALSLSGEVLVFDGIIESDSMTRLQSAVAGRKVARLRIRSGGGEVGAAIAIARWVHANGIDVEVDGACFSSCANYIFPAGRHKYIVGDGLVAWHGTVEHLLYRHEQGMQSVEARLLPSLREIVAVERSFYADTGINSFLGWFGKMAPYHAHNMYFMSADDMAYFGLRNLHLPATYMSESPRKWIREQPGVYQALVVDRRVTNPSDPRWR